MLYYTGNIQGSTFEIVTFFSRFQLTKDDYDDFIGYGYSKREARMNAAQNAYQYLEENDELLLPIDEVGEPELDRAINQLQEFYPKGYIDEPYYKFYEDHDDNGNPTWRCECHIKGADSIIG